MKQKKQRKNQKKIRDVTLAHDDGLLAAAHNEQRVSSQSGSETNVTTSLLTEELTDVTLASGDDQQIQAHKKKKRKFKRRCMQPQPKKKKTRSRRRSDNVVTENISWNGILKNISGESVTKIEEKLFARGQQFCPVEMDPPVVRMQDELNRFFRILRIKWHFQGKIDERSELEKKFYLKSDWEPPRACVELEKFIKNLQYKFDSWKPPRWIRDNLSQEERNLLRNIKNNTNIVFMWEDKGPSFTKMTKEQYIMAGVNELENVQFYQEIQGDPSQSVKSKSDRLFQNMCQRGEISEKVSEYLQCGQAKMSNFYHLLKTHKIPLEVNDPKDWLLEKGFPIRGIISGRDSPTERLSGFVEHFLQPGMTSLPSFLKDTKHVLQIIEDINEKIDLGEVSLDGVGLVTLDVEKMYNTMTEDLALRGTKAYFEKRNQQGDDELNLDERNVTPQSILEGLEICLKNNFSSSMIRNTNR